jgi:hypothetical protein
MPLTKRFLGHFEEVPQKTATFWGTFEDVPQKMATLGALLKMPQKFVCIYYNKLKGY